MRRPPLVGLCLAASLIVAGACSAPDSGVTIGASAPRPGEEGPPTSVAGTTPVPTTPAPTTAPATTVPPGPPDQAAPVVGECRGPVSGALIEAPTDTRPPVPCDQPHGFETFFVGELPDGDWPGAGDNDEAYGFIDESCNPAHDAYLGPEGPVDVPDRIGAFAFFVPTEADWARGQRWFRCDAFVQPFTAAEETSIAGTLAGVYATPLPAAYRICEAPDRTPLSCDQPHLAEWLAYVDVPELETYPAPTGNEVIEGRCATAVQQVLGTTGPRPDLTVGYGLPNPIVWDDPDARRAVCVAAATDSRPLVGTLAGIGDTAPLPATAPAAGA